MASKRGDFKEVNQVKHLYKDSLFKNFFAGRKNLLEGYPAAGKGLQFADPVLQIGPSTQYTFSPKGDKICCKHGGTELSAVHKANGRFQVCYKHPCSDEVKGFAKYEERGTAAPGLVFGLNAHRGDLDCMGKLNLASGMMKVSGMYNLDSMVSGMRMAADAKMDTGLGGSGAGKAPMWNIAASYDHATLGHLGAAYNHGGAITLNYALDLGTSLGDAVPIFPKGGKSSLCAETVIVPSAMAKGAGGPPPFQVGIGHQIDKEHHVKARLNGDGQLQCMMQKSFNSHLKLNAGAMVNLAQPDTLLSSIPSLGFKVEIKG